MLSVFGSDFFVKRVQCGLAPTFDAGEYPAKAGFSQRGEHIFVTSDVIAARLHEPHYVVRKPSVDKLLA